MPRTFCREHKSKKIHLYAFDSARSDRLSDGSRTYGFHRLIKYLNKVHAFAVLAIDYVSCAVPTIVSYRLARKRFFSIGSLNRTTDDKLHHVRRHTLHIELFNKYDMH